MVGVDGVGRSTLLEFVALRFVEEVERLLHEGLAKGYRSVESNDTAFRGRLLVAENLRENVARADRFYVRFSAFDRDVSVNRILGAALDALGDLRARAERAGATRRVLDRVSEIGRPALRSDLFDRLVLGRSAARYRDPLVLARMILERQAPELRHERALGTPCGVGVSACRAERFRCGDPGIARFLASAAVDGAHCATGSGGARAKDEATCAGGGYQVEGEPAFRRVGGVCTGGGGAVD